MQEGLSELQPRIGGPKFRMDKKITDNGKLENLFSAVIVVGMLGCQQTPVKAPAQSPVGGEIFLVPLKAQWETTRGNIMGMAEMIPCMNDTEVQRWFPLFYNICE
jgi:hypothetical protein